MRGCLVRVCALLQKYYIVCLQGYDSLVAVLLPGHLHLDTV